MASKVNQESGKVAICQHYSQADLFYFSLFYLGGFVVFCFFGFFFSLFYLLSQIALSSLLLSASLG